MKVLLHFFDTSNGKRFECDNLFGTVFTHNVLEIGFEKLKSDAKVQKISEMATLFEKELKILIIFL